MFNVYEFVINGIDYDGNILENIWVIRSQHTQLIDAEVQLQRFVDQGILPENLKIEQESL